MWHKWSALTRAAALAGTQFVVVLGCFAAYVGHSGRGGLSAEGSQVFTEGPLLAYLLALLHAPLRPGRWRFAVAAWPLVWLYLLHDEYFVRWGDVPALSDVALLFDLWVVLGVGFGLLVLLLLVCPLGLWLASVDRVLRRPDLSTLLLVTPLLLVIGALRFAPARVYALMNSVTEDAEWSDRRNAELWGRLYAVLLRQARSASFAEEARDFVPLSRSSLHLNATQLASIDRRNVHVIVLESFVDLRLLSGVTFSKPPFDAEFSRWVDPFISTSVSPVFGGETARAEFEVLCGVPSLRRFGLEFLGFRGGRTYCLPTILGEAGYRTVLTFPHGPIFFNTRRAYPGLGFQQLIYGDRFSTPGAESIVLGEDEYLEDADLFPQNLKKVRALVKAGRPFLNYVMTIYGHWPFDIDVRRHPSEITVSPAEPDVQKIANQMLLRTRALRTHVAALVEADPTGIIVLVGDHLPPLPGGKADYLRLGYAARAGMSDLGLDLTPYENFLLVFVAGVPRKLPRMRHFDLPRWLLNELTHGVMCRHVACDFGRLPLVPARYLTEYETILGLAAGD